MRRCARCHRERDEVYFRQIGWRLDRVTPMWGSYCEFCNRELDAIRRANPEYQMERRVKRRERYRRMGK